MLRVAFVIIWLLWELTISIIFQVGLHPEFENSRCLFIVRKDGEQVDFSFWKCVKGLIRQKYPMYADSFILRHFRRRQDYWSGCSSACFRVTFLWYWFVHMGFNILRFRICWNPCGVVGSKEVKIACRWNFGAPVLACCYTVVMCLCYFFYLLNAQVVSDHERSSCFVWAQIDLLSNERMRQVQKI